MARDSMGGGFMSRLTPRERTYILVLVLVFFGMGTLVLLYLRDKALRDIEEGIASTRRALDAVHTRGAVYKERLAEKEEREAKISSDTLLFSTLVEESTVAGETVKVSNEEELTAMELGGGLIKRSYKFNLSSVTLEDLVKFLTKIESKPGHVIITDHVVIRSPSSAEDRLNVEVTIATWERREKEKPAAAEGTEEGAGS
ncbi:hypothetical protein [Paraliomyxa miuraensis]|uniref:hypothetical protein n=1 Tax=Paraliomyxa miuraensis TaxID=376150 RepID=UPI0022537510|nr:hypothetical protein [Paraliomyxa miuraensis]MCX4242957.1 hypothetical protein [Paraliomyxa miuraensis]